MLAVFYNLMTHPVNQPVTYLRVYLVDSIVKTLTQLEEVDSVQILVEGKIVETITGHISIKKPLN